MNKSLQIHASGFTLLEVLIALSIFALLATITSAALERALRNGQHLSEQAKRLHELQLTLARLTHDTLQATNRAVRGDSMRLFPAFIGQPTYIEFTRTGDRNPILRQSHLRRIGYVCQNHRLIRRVYPQLDPLTRHQVEDEIILDHLTQCRFAFLNAALQLLPVWHNGTQLDNQAIEALPKAVQLKISLASWGELVSIFTLPEALYTDKRL